MANALKPNPASSSSTAGAAPAVKTPANVQEFKIRVPKNIRKKHHVMRFNATLNVDFAQWRSVKMERENNLKEFRGLDDDMPKFGAGSEYNRDLKEEARRKKFGIIAKRYRPEAQPWILKVGGKSGKKFKGIREGGVSENAAFYVFTHAPDGAIEAYPLNEWYNFQPIQRYKSLSAEEAEHEFGRRKKVMNYFSLMLRKRLKGDDDGDVADPEEMKVKGGGGGGGGGKKSKELKISEMDEWIDTEDESDSDEDDEEKKKKEDSDNEGGKSKKGKKGAEKKKKKKDVEDEAFEESDDGDEEGREMDYDTESSEDDIDPEGKLDKDMKSVAEEDALRKLLTSDEDDDEEKREDDSENDEEGKKKKDKKEENVKEKKKSKAAKPKEDNKKADTSSDFSSNSSDSEDDNKKKPKDNKSTSSNIKSRSATPTTSNVDPMKRKGNNMPSDLTASENSNSPGSTPAKRQKTENAPSMLSSNFAGVVSSNSKDDYGITEEAVRRYLMRKPMTATELLTKFKNKKTGVSSDRLVETMTQILKKINPVKQTIQGKMYLSIKVNK